MRKVPRPVEGVMLSLLTQLATELDCVVAAGGLCVRGRHAYGTYMLVEPDGRAHLHDKDIPSGTENFYNRGGNDDGVVTVASWDRRMIGLASGMEWTRVRTARRLRAAQVQLVIGGQCWPWTAVNWWGPVGRWSLAQYRHSQRQLQEAPSLMARLVGAPAVMASHAGDMTMRTPFVPGVRWRSPMLGETRICDRDGTTLAHLPGSAGEGHIAATIELAPPTPKDPLPQRYWTIDVPWSISAMFHGFNAVGASAYAGRHIRQRFPWQDGRGADLPDESPPRALIGPTTARRPRRVANPTITVTVLRRREIAQDVVHLTLVSAEGNSLPPWKPGAHIDLHLPEGTVRQYSLCGDHLDAHYEVAVLHERAGRGGSAFVHDQICEGDQLEISSPRNLFPLNIKAPNYLFIAGGIGITPLRAMINDVAARKRNWRLVYVGRTAESMAFADELLARHPQSVTLHPRDRVGRLELEPLLSASPRESEIYCGGPEPLLEAVEKLCVDKPPGALRTERFQSRYRDTGETDVPFDVKLARSGRTVRVPEDQSILVALERVGIDVDNTCRSGICGSCEVGVLEGVPDHRDSVLPHAGGDVSNRILTCVSRACSATLTLDL
jgi:ferredoxin-NADP reductase